MTMRHRITGDGESDDGLGCCAATWTVRTISGSTVTGTVDVPAPSLYIEDPHSDTDVNSLPTYRSDTVAATASSGVTMPTITAVSGVDVTLSLNVFFTNEIGTAIVDSTGAPFYVVASSSATSVTVDREGMATGQIEAFYPVTPRTITYGIHAEGFPQIEKFYERGWINFQLLRGGRSYRYICQSFDSDSGTLVSQSIDYDATLSRLYDDRGYQSRREIPREQTRAIGLRVSVVLEDPVSYWQLGAMAYTYRPTSDRSESRRA